MLSQKLLEPAAKEQAPSQQLAEKAQQALLH